MVPGFNVRDGGPVQPVNMQQLALAGFRPPPVMSMPGLPQGVPPGGQTPGFNLPDLSGLLRAGLAAFGKDDPGAAAQAAANAADARVQANPGTSIAGMQAGTNPDFGIVPQSMIPPPDDSSGVGLPTRVDFLTGLLTRLGLR